MSERTKPTLDLRRRLSQGRVLVSHFLVYCAGVCLLSMVNMFLGGHAWFQWPSLVWGVLLVVHVFTAVTSGSRTPPLHG
jgi:hypothetical protein